jgi:transmembrane sensor
LAAGIGCSQLEQIALHTGHGQQLSRHLPDGSQLDLAPGTDASVLLYRQRREVHLQQGEIRLDVAHDAQSPLEVHGPGPGACAGYGFFCGAAACRPAGQRRSGACGSVEAGPHDGSEPDAMLTAGQGLRLCRRRARAHSPNASDVGAWREGWLVFDRTPLTEVVARWNDYLAQPMVLDDAALCKPCD